MFNDRKNAGRKLADSLIGKISGDALLVGINKGGAKVTRAAASKLNKDWSALAVVSFPLPNPIGNNAGAVAEDGSVCLNALGREIACPPPLIKTVLENEKIASCQGRKLRKGLVSLKTMGGREVVLVEDGIAVGVTSRAAIKYCRKMGAQRVLIATPIASPDAVTCLETIADDVIALLCPPFFNGIEEAYRRTETDPD